MKIVRASKKLDKAIDALIDLQQDYADEVEAAEVTYDLAITIDTLNRMSTAIDMIEETK